MFKQIICLCLVVYGAAALTYDEAFKNCKTKFSIESDAPLDYFYEKGVFESGKENLKCFFGCLTADLKLIDDDGDVNGEAVKKLAEEHSHCKELAAFAQPEVIQNCLPVKDASTPCDKSYNFVKCAIDLKNSQSANKSTSSS